MTPKETKKRARGLQRRRVDIVPWTLETTDTLDDVTVGTLIRRAVNETISLAVADEVTAYFPLEFYPACDGIDGEAVDTPDTVYVCLPLGPSDEEEDAVWSFSLIKMVRGFIDWRKPGSRDEADGDYDRYALEQMRDHLRRCADEVDRALQGMEKARAT